MRDALVLALSDALDVDADRLTVSIKLDDESVPASRLPLRLELTAPVAEAPAADEPDDLDEADGADEVDDLDEADGADEVDDRRAGSSEVEDAPAGRAPRDRDDAPRERSGRPAADAAPITAEDLDEEAEAAADLLEGLLDALDLPGDLRISVQDAHAEVEVVGLEEGVLIGRRGQTLDAVQELVRTAMQRRFERRSRVLVDVDGYRARRMEKLLERADEAVEEVLATGEPQRLEPMDAIERRLVHQRVAETDGVVSTSHGREPARRIVIELADD